MAVRRVQLVAIGFTLLCSNVPAQEVRTPELDKLAFRLSTDRAEYVTGEMVVLDCGLIAREEGVWAPSRMSVTNGSVRVFVSRSPFETYEEYVGPGWDTADTDVKASVLLSRGQTVRTTAMMLYNGHRGAPLSQRYVFGENGTYRVKAVYRNPYFEGEVWSDPIEIRVLDASGEDAEVWRTLRQAPELGYLMQAGFLPGVATNDMEDRTVALLEDMLSRAPSSRYSAQIRRGLERFQQVIEAERKRRK